MDQMLINQDGNNLIATKLQAPKLTRSNVTREQLTEKIRGKDGQSALFAAAAGYGKTTFMCQIYDFLCAEGYATAWLSIDALDDSPQTFLGYFVQLLINAGVIDKGEFFQQTNFAEEQEFEVAFDLISQAAARVSKPTAVFFDDLHFIENTTLLNGLSRFLDSKSDKLCVYISARSAPRLAFDRREIEGKFLIFDSSKLKFSQIEAETFFEKSESPSLMPSDVAQILKSTEGWAAGLQIASISMNTSSARLGTIPAQFSGSKERVARYLYDNVMGQISSKVRDFLFSTAPLSRFCIPMCEFVRGEKGNRAILQWLIDTNLFLVALDDEGVWFRYHHLFAEFLNETAESESGFSRSLIHDRASQWCLENGYLDEAVNYLLDIKDFDKAARIISTSAPRIARQKGDNRLLIRWIERLPEDHQRRYPAMMLDYAFTLAFTHSTEQALAVVNQVRAAVESFEQEPTSATEILAYADTVEALALAAQDETEAALEKISDARLRWPSSDAVVQGITANVAAYSHMVNNRAGAAVKEAMNARIFGMQADSQYVWLWADCIEVMAHCRTGNLEAAASPLRRAIVDASAEGENTLLGLMVHMLSANLAYLKGNVDQAQKELASGTGYSATYGPLEPLLISHKIRAGCAAIAGNFKRALEVLERGQTLGLRIDLPSLTLTSVCLEISIHCRRGNPEVARRIAERWGIYDGSWRTRFKNSNETTAVCQRRIVSEVAIAEGNFGLATQTIEDLERRLKNRWPQEELLTLSVLKAYAYYQSGRSNDAAREISRAAQLSKKTDILIPFLEFPDYVRPILSEVIDMRREVGTAEELIQESPEFKLLKRIAPKDTILQTVEAANEDAWIVEDLTNREIELLQLIESGMTNAQLAAHLVLSVATVKWHLHNVFQKLGVKNRMGALATARKRGLL